MALPPCPACCASTRDVAATAVTAAPVVMIVRLVWSIIGALSDAAASRASSFHRLANLVLRLCVEIARIVPLVQLACRIAPGAVDHAAAFYGWSCGNCVGPALYVLVLVHGQKFAAAVEQPLGQRAIPRPDRDIGDRIVAAGEILDFGKPAVEHIELALHFHGKAVDGVF